MSLVRKIHIFCDGLGCTELIDSAISAKKGRQFAASLGWTYQSAFRLKAGQGGVKARDLCRACTAKEAPFRYRREVDGRTQYSVDGKHWIAR